MQQCNKERKKEEKKNWMRKSHPDALPRQAWDKFNVTTDHKMSSDRTEQNRTEQNRTEQNRRGAGGFSAPLESERVPANPKGPCGVSHVALHSITV
jgi:hypothetical protein